MSALQGFYRSVIPRRARQYIAGGRWQVQRCLRGTMAHLLIRAGRPLVNITLSHGHFRVDLRDRGVGRYLYVTRRYVEAETEFIVKNLSAGMTFLDVGANLGYYSVLASRLVGPQGRVVSFEPEPHNFRLLCENVRRNQIANVQLFNKALGERAGSMPLFRSSSNFGDHRLTPDPGFLTQDAVAVEVVVLDDLLGQKRIPVPDFIKIDVQGYEGKVVDGMRKLLSSDRPLTVLSEFWPYGLTACGTPPVEYYDLMCRYGFSTFLLDAAGDSIQATWQEICKAIPPVNPRHPDASYVNIVFRRG